MSKQNMKKQERKKTLTLIEQIFIQGFLMKSFII